jgi:hypothetical protein
LLAFSTTKGQDYNAKLVRREQEPSGRILCSFLVFFELLSWGGFLYLSISTISSPRSKFGKATELREGIINALIGGQDGGN